MLLSYCSYFLDSFVTLVTIVALLLFWFILFAHLEFALNVSMVIFCGRAMEGAGNASHRAGPGWIQQASTGSDRSHDMRGSMCTKDVGCAHTACLPTLGDWGSRQAPRTPNARPVGLSCIATYAVRAESIMLPDVLSAQSFVPLTAYGFL